MRRCKNTKEFHSVRTAGYRWQGQPACRRHGGFPPPRRCRGARRFGGRRSAKKSKKVSGFFRGARRSSFVGGGRSASASLWRTAPRLLSPRRGRITARSPAPPKKFPRLFWIFCSPSSPRPACAPDTPRVGEKPPCLRHAGCPCQR